MESPQNHFCPFWSLSNSTLPNMSKWSQTWCACTNGVIMHLDQIAKVGEKDIFIKVPQNPFWPDPNLNNSTLPTFYLWPQILWTWSQRQMMTLHQVVNQGGMICMTKSWKSQFCWILGFAKVTLETFFKWAQNWYTTSILYATWSC